MALNSSGQLSLGGNVTGESISLQLGLSPTAQVSLNDAAVRALAGIPEGPIRLPIDFWGKPAFVSTDKGIFAFGSVSGFPNEVSVSNLVSNLGFVTTDNATVAAKKTATSACGYGGDKGIFGFGFQLRILPNGQILFVGNAGTQLVSNTGVMSADRSGVGTIRYYVGACSYGEDLGVFVYGGVGVTVYSVRNDISNTGVVSGDAATVGTTREGLAAAKYGGDKGILGYGTSNTTNYLSMTNLISDTGVLATDTTGVGTGRVYLAACSYGGDKAVFGYGAGPSGTYYSMTNLVSNTGVVATDTAGVGTQRWWLAACGFGGDKGMFGFGLVGGYNTPGATFQNVRNRVSNTGVTTSDEVGIGTARGGLGACGYGLA